MCTMRPEGAQAQALSSCSPPTPPKRGQARPHIIPVVTTHRTVYGDVTQV